MIEEIAVDAPYTLEQYAEDFRLSQSVHELKNEAQLLAPKLRGRRVWMVNSTAQGGGVAEMLPRVVSMLSELGVDTRWLVMNTEKSEFFPLTKRIHNLIHGSGEPQFTADDGELYRAVSEEVADGLLEHLAPKDILVCHDPQPVGACQLASQKARCRSVWRCHIGLDVDLPQTQAAWEFLRPSLSDYDHFVFSAPEYIPDYVSGNVSIIYPALDPFSHKNRSLSIHKLGGILSNAKLTTHQAPVVTPDFDSPALRLMPDGRFVAMSKGEDLGLFYRPIVTQISRWDRLKGWRPLLDAFAMLKRKRSAAPSRPETRASRTLSLARLVLAGPEPAAVQDDPEAAEVLQELIVAYTELPQEIQKDVALLSLPMSSRKENALIVNALQRCSSIVVQNSLREGFGLTVAEAMWKNAAVIGSNACGIRHQIRQGISGHIHPEPESAESLSEALETLLVDPAQRALYGSRGERRVAENFLVFNQVSSWLRVLEKTIDRQ